MTDMLCGSGCDEGVTAEKVFGGKLIYEPDPVKAAQLLLERIDQKRVALGI
ncbi:hypothetical protein H1S01_07355 [Heliobacterium chlorum]|uniref:Uncharacterized protein n=1 Tax=Heliobacterium chlorum TaxID=2698 RepID=A0ABR7T2H3_HELCL|nr:hypothetical protein [Heliobacterium chlorum]MBC9784327.1 hypothetical protein [Heliobacterium chlorum]